MVGITTLHKIFEGRKEIPESELKAGLVSGGVVALAEKLRTSHAWNGINLLAAPMLTLEAGAVVDSRWAVWKNFALIKMDFLMSILIQFGQ